jgi:hypothetical protein
MKTRKEPEDEKKAVEDGGKKTTESLSTPDAQAEKEVRDGQRSDIGRVSR